VTVISTNLFTPQLASYLANSENRPQAGNTPAAAAPSSAITVTLSQAALEALGEKSLATVIADAQANMKTLLAESGKTSPLEKDALEVDLTQFDRRELFAIASNAGEQFPPDQQKAASLELQRRFDVALAGPAGVQRITGNVEALYEAAAAYLDAAGPEKKASSQILDQRAAVTEALEQLATDHDKAPAAGENDPVTDYLARTANGETVKERDFSALANDVRTTLDKQYGDAEDTDERPSFGENRRTKTDLDFSRFGGRSLSAIVLNAGDQFNNAEVRAAKTEVDSRVGKIVLSAFQSSGRSNDLTAFSKNLIAQYESLSGEERVAAGFTQAYYNTIVSNYETSVRISESFSGFFASGGSAGINGIPSMFQFL
jgi:hypothetical protein